MNLNDEIVGFEGACKYQRRGESVLHFREVWKSVKKEDQEQEESGRMKTMKSTGWHP